MNGGRPGEMKRAKRKGMVSDLVSAGPQLLVAVTWILFNVQPLVVCFTPCPLPTNSFSYFLPGYVSSAFAQKQRHPDSIEHDGDCRGTSPL